MGKESVFKEKINTHPSARYKTSRFQNFLCNETVFDDSPQSKPDHFLK